MDRRALHRMSRHSILVLLFFTGIGFVLSLVPNLAWAGSGFSFAFFIGGLVWIAVAYFSGGFVSTYVAPIGGGRGTALYYANAYRFSNLPSAAGAEVTADLRNKLDDQPIMMAIAFAKGLAFFGLATVFYLIPIAGTAILAGVFVLFAVMFVRSRPRLSGPRNSGPGLGRAPK